MGRIIGVLGYQGDVAEHVTALTVTLKKLKKNFEVKVIKKVDDLKNICALTIPGGESTTISRLIINHGLYEPIRKIAKEGIPILGTCAGCILLAKKIVDKDSRVKPLEIMNIQVKRNVYGRQRESFEIPLNVSEFTTRYSLPVTREFNAVFIRAPAITRVWGDCKVLAKVDDNIVIARQDNLFALTFHPELTEDTLLFEWFLNEVM
mgnify:CR=1 FL=1